MNYSPLYGTARQVPARLQHTITGTKGVQGIPSIHDKNLTDPRKDQAA